MSKLDDINDDLTVTIRPFHVSNQKRTAERSYLLVFEGSSSSTFDLPPTGELIIGRSQEAQVRLEDSSASRKHARIMVTSREVVLMDLGSHNGTRVNGERISGPKVLTSGDVISICTVTLVFHRDVRPIAGRPILDQEKLRQRLEEEIDRALRYRRHLSLLSLRLLGEVSELQHVPRALAGQLRLIDTVAWDGSAQLMLLLPEMDKEEVEETAQQVSHALGSVASEIRTGYATCPEDGCDVDALLGSARDAASAASRPGQLAKAADTVTAMKVGDQEIVVVDPAMVRLYALIEKLALSDLAVLICGETGAGKEIAASAIHHWSRRKDKPLVTLNCAALPENLVESELFGHEKGAFSGAVQSKIGLLESASGGTVFLDEVGELPLAIQAKLLRVLETQRMTRVGDVRERAIDIRLVAATNRVLSQEISQGRFRQDLFFRLSVARVMLPPLRDRRRELPVLARTLLEQACQKLGRQQMTISMGAMQRLLAHSFPGNVRELKNLMELVAATVPDPTVESWHVEDHLEQALESAQVGATEVAAEPGPEMKGARRKFRAIDEEVRELERARMLEALDSSGGVQVRAAELISMPLRTFATKVKQYNISPRKQKGEAEG